MNMAHTTKSARKKWKAELPRGKKDLNESLLHLVELNLYNDEKKHEFTELLDDGAEVNFENPDFEDFTPLAHVISMKKFNFVELLLENGADTEMSDIRLKAVHKCVTTDFAWKCENYSVVYQLLKHDAAFPKSFETDTQNLSITEKTWKLAVIRFTTRDRIEFHKNIQGGEMTKVQDYVSKNQHLKFAYDDKNQCALSTALKAKQLNIYAFLCSKGYFFGIDTNEREMTRLFTRNDKIILENRFKTYFKSPKDRHIIKLTSKSKLYLHDEQVDFEKITHFYETLNEIEAIKPILKIVSSSIKSIVFDFKRGSIRSLDWTSDYLKDVKGRTYYDKGHILIGALRDSEDEVLGTLAHEFAHLALQDIYENSCAPYCKDDFERKHHFERIVDAYDNEEFQSKSEIIKNAYGSGKKHLKVVELIVRIPHLIALHRHEPEKLSEHRVHFKDLFDFYDNKVLPDIKAACVEIDTKRKIKQLNDSLGLISKFESLSTTLVNNRLDLDEIFSDKNIFILSDVPDLVFRDLITYQKSYKRNLNSVHIFIDLSHLSDRTRSEKILEFYHSEVKPKVFIYNSCSGFSVQAVEDMLEPFISMSRIVYVSNTDFPKVSKL